MKLVRLSSPGTVCQYAAIEEMVRQRRLTGRFIEVGCGDGALAGHLCEIGFSGVGVDAAATAIALAERNLNLSKNAGSLKLVCKNIFDQDILECTDSRADFVVSIMVMEHVKDDLGFCRRLTQLIKPGCHVLLVVPARKDYWGIEDETVGHYRRYERDELASVMRGSGLLDLEIWSLGVPTSNLLFPLDSFLLRRNY